MFTYDNCRPWQKRYFDKLNTWKETTFLCVALPGSGKTLPTLLFAKSWLEENDRRLVVVVAPTRNVRRQWRNIAYKCFKLDFQVREFDGGIKVGMRGVVVTYSTVAMNSQSFRTLCEQHEVLVVFDEFHHAGESQTWGLAVLEAFGSASMRIALSGTPWRSDGGVMPFLERDETDEYIRHEYHDWPAALEEEPRAIRELAFYPYHGDATILNRATGKTRTVHSATAMISTDDEAKCLRGRVSNVKWYRNVLVDAVERLRKLRRTVSDAAGIVVCVDITHAGEVADALAEVTGRDPVLVTSDDRDSEKLIEKFAESKDEWIVAVRQVSEGADIPRLMVGVFLTNYTTELYFRQFIGRVVRHRGTEHDNEAYIYYPFHSDLHRYAEEILKMQAIAIQRMKDRDPGQPADPPPSPTLGSVVTEVSEAEFAGNVLPMVGKSYGPDRATAIANFAEQYRLTENKAAEIMLGLGLIDDEPGTPDAEKSYASGDDDRPLEDRIDDMRKRQNRRIGYWAKLTGRTYEELQNEASDAAGIWSVKDKSVTEDQLIRREVYIEQKIFEARRRTPQ
jgi:superfamily II DNA or RNA helicase